ncbi:peptide alpha-N-acetyltransferase [Cryptococcus deuterogattii 99/473]|uniref:Peptide alpha-N-acetyltransferase n=1 Tax=Cryptococcus deuterogattii Ram5 TaxID=1296110 RepID=A0A0D0V132_9TREE|nr:peptide alpha-N-acetyltransferase [Cryptococcus deuterogattii Ram5]KIY54415.1 peptide alpha-N-acetyltransferase [Cryptococcus deuterogattii 99/473]
MSLPLARIRPMSLTRVRGATAIRPTLLRPTAFHFSRSLAPPLTSSLSSRSDHSGSSSNADETKKQQQQKSDGPESETEPKSAYAKFKALSRKYGSWAIGMYFFLSTIDFSLCFLLVHSLGAERIEPLMDSAKEFYRSKRYGVEEAERMRIEDEKEREEEMAAEKKDGKQGKSGSGWFGKTFWAEAVLAYTIHKTALLPFRAGLTVAWTPKFVGWLAKRGWVGKVRSSLFSL